MGRRNIYDFEMEYILFIYEEFSRNKKKTAEILEISRTMLMSKLKHCGILDQ